MTPVIHVLDAHSANQIAAGEVVERPASLVKELVENAVDAHAIHIDILVEGNGVPLIQVRDDGWGISRADLPLAVIRHATSKITHIEDLDQLSTLGFRGEALPSIASVSEMEIISRPADEMVGLSLTLQGGEQTELKEVGCPVGTSVKVRNLFFNTPARLKFLKSTATEFGLISDIIGRIALAHPEISFSLTHPQQVVLQTSGRGDLRETIASVLGHSIARQLLPISAQQGDWSLTGFISPPDLVRSSKQTQMLMINGRSIRSALLSRALQEGYHTLIPAKLFPIVILHLKVPPADYDVNVHPTKMDVRFKHEQDLSSFISRAVYQTLIKSKPLPAYETRSTQAIKAKQADSLQSPSSNSNTAGQIRELEIPMSTASKTDLNANNPLNSNKPLEQPDQSMVKVDQIKLFNTSYPKVQMPQEQPPENSGQSIPAGFNQSVSPVQPASPVNLNQPVSSKQGEILEQIWPLGQLFNTYIMATDGQNLVMIDQHAAHERINFERLFKEFQEAKQLSQSLLIPLPMEFTLQEEQVLLEHLWSLTEMGFILEQFGERTYLLRGVPVQTGFSHPDKLLREFVDTVLLKNAAPSFNKLMEEWIYLLACKESIKAQDSLSILEMEQLIAQLRLTNNPYTCPHGRPTMIKLTRSELERRFYRS